MSATETRKRMTPDEVEAKFAEYFPTSSSACYALCERFAAEEELYQEAEANNDKAAAKRILAVLNSISASIRFNHCKCTPM
jgi:hypothetical protein